MALAVTALALGLLASAAVTDPAQATLALPMLCFPAVLVRRSGPAGLATWPPAARAISVFVPARWGYEAVLHDLGLGGSAARRRFSCLFTAVFLASRRSRAQPEELTTAAVWRATIRFSSLTTTCTSNGREVVEPRADLVAQHL